MRSCKTPPCRVAGARLRGAGRKSSLRWIGRREVLRWHNFVLREFVQVEEQASDSGHHTCAGHRSISDEATRSILGAGKVSECLSERPTRTLAQNSIYKLGRTAPTLAVQSVVFQRSLQIHKPRSQANSCDSETASCKSSSDRYASNTASGDVLTLTSAVQRNWHHAVQ